MVIPNVDPAARIVGRQEKMQFS